MLTRDAADRLEEITAPTLHVTNMEQPEVFNRVLLDHLRRYA